MAGQWEETGRGVVHPWLCDQFGHLNVRNYVQFFDDASFQIWTLRGVGVRRMREHGVIAVVATTKYDFVKEMLAGQLLVMRSAFTHLGEKSVGYQTRMYDADDGTLHAVNTAVEVFFDPETRTPAPMPDFFRPAVEPHLVDPDAS